MVVGALGVYLWSFFRGGGSTSSGPPTGKPGGEPSYIVAADDAGAIVLDGQRQTVRGVSRSGGDAWTSTRAFADGDTVVCAGTCPAAVASGGIDALNGLGTPTVTPLNLGGATASYPSAFKSTVVAATGAKSVLVQGDASGSAWVSIGGSRVPAASAQVAVVQGSSGASLVIGSRPDGASVVRSLTAGHDGWVLGAELPAHGFFGCAGAGGRVAFGGDDGVLIAKGGTRTVVPGVKDPSECSFTRSGLVVAQFSAGASATTTTVQVSTSAGKARWTREFQGEARVSANPREDAFVVTDGKTARVYAGDGSLQRTVENVSHAVYLPSGQLVALGTAGGVKWL
ncbi:hypothetical protein GCM10012283_20190 [Phycicoccus endophyticus]|nr:hypothetical protein GCM10012283_20190 [Phycicoccus endophyticus]